MNMISAAMISVAMIRANIISYDNNSDELFLSNMNILLNTHVPYVEFGNSPDTICWYEEICRHEFLLPQPWLGPGPG